MKKGTPPDKFHADYRNFFRDFPNFDVNLRVHARKRMRQRNIHLPQIRSVLKTGALVHVESDIRTGLDKYRVAGSDADGRRLEVVANLDKTGQGCVVIVTVIDQD